MLDRLFGTAETTAPRALVKTGMGDPGVLSSMKDTGDARKRLRWWCQEANKEPQAHFLTICPSMAYAMMERNQDDEWRNRPSSEKGVRRYVRAMKAGWKLTGETIVFGRSGRLLNGQHRLKACMESGATFPCLVVFGIDDNAFTFMDSGIKRTAGHIFAIDGVPNAAGASAATRLLYGYDKERDWSGNAPDVDSDPLLAFYHENEGLAESVNVGQRLYHTRLMVISWASFLHYVMTRKSRSEANDFFEKLITGIGLTSKNDPVWKLRNKLETNARSDSASLSLPHIGAFTVQAWNAVRTGSSRDLFRWRGEQAPNQSFPRVV